MMDWTTYYYSVIDLTTLLIAVLGISVVLILRDLENRWRWFFVVFFSDMIFKTSASLISRFSAVYWNNIPLQTACDFLGVLFSSTIIPLLTLYILRCCSQEPRQSFLWKLILILWGLSAAAAVGDLLTRTLFAVPTQDGTEQKRWLILVYLFFTAISLIVCFVAVIRRRKQLSKDVAKFAEDAKVAVRNIRREANDSFKKLAKTEVSEDEIKDLEGNKNKAIMLLYSPIFT